MVGSRKLSNDEVEALLGGLDGEEAVSYTHLTLPTKDSV